MTLLDLVSVLRLLLGVVLAFVVIPRLVLPRPAAARSNLDAAVINALRWMFVVVIASHVLTLLGLYSFVSMAGVALLVGWFSTWRKRVGGAAGLLLRLWPNDEGPVLRTPRRPRVPWSARAAGFGLIAPVLALMLVSYWLRLEVNLGTMSLTVSDAYIHMGWAEQLKHGALWQGGYYPTGFATVLAYVQLFTPGLDMYGVARYGAGLVSTTLVFGLYFCLVRLTGNPGAALLGAGSFGLFSGHEAWREPWHRTVSLLPQEFAFGVAMLVLPFAVVAITEWRSGAVGELHRRSHTITLALGVFVICQLHPLSGGFGSLLAGLAGGVAAVLTWRWRAALLPLGAIVLPLGINGIAPQVMEVLGYPQYAGGLGGISGQYSTDPAQAAFIQQPYTGLAYLAFAGGLVAAVTGVVMLRRQHLRALGVQVLALATVCLSVTALYDLEPLAEGLGLSLFVLTRIAQLVGITMPLAIGLTLAALSLLAVRLRPLPAAAGLLVAGTTALLVFGTAFPGGRQDLDSPPINYDTTVRQARAISQSFSPNAVTIVSTSDIRLATLGRTRYTELWVFARDLEKIGMDEDLPIPTPQVFILVEKRPFPVAKLTPYQASEEYYQDPVKRGRIMARTYVWAQRYMREGNGPGEMSVYFEDEDIVVFRYRRNPALVTDVSEQLFTDYRWRTGELFNEGPADPLVAWAQATDGEAAGTADALGPPVGPR